MGQHTPLYQAHLDANARMVDFGGWDMPINYGSQIEEHHQVRRAAGMFDVSHMTVVEVEGPQSRDYLRYLLANDVNRLTRSGRALYSCMLNDEGGVVDDLIAYYLSDEHYRLVVNAATREKDLAWMHQHVTAFETGLTERTDLAMLAVQGPAARATVAGLLDDGAEADALKPFSAASIQDMFIARTGYTGEDGFEILLAADQAVAFWNRLLDAGVAPCGLGARDTLRLEAGMNLYGQDMDETTSPLESGLGWTIALKDDRPFIGRALIEEQKQTGVANRFTGLVLEERGVMRPGQTVSGADGSEGVTTSGGFSPTLEKAIALARLPKSIKDSCAVEIRGKQLRARLVKPPFVRNGQACDGIL